MANWKQHTSNSSDVHRTSVTFAHTMGTESDRGLLLFATSYRDDNAESVSGTPTYGGDNFTLVAATDKQVVGGNPNNRRYMRVELWKLATAKTGSNTVSLTWADGGGHTSADCRDRVTVVEVNGVDSSDIVAASTVWQGAKDTSPTVNITTTAANQLVAYFQAQVDDTNASTPSGYTERAEFSNSATSFRQVYGTDEKATAQQYTLSSTLGSSDEWYCMAVALADPAGAVYNESVSLGVSGDETVVTALDAAGALSLGQSSGLTLATASIFAPVVTMAARMGPSGGGSSQSWLGLSTGAYSDGGSTQTWLGLEVGALNEVSALAMFAATISQTTGTTFEEAIAAALSAHVSPVTDIAFGPSLALGGQAATAVAASLAALAQTSLPGSAGVSAAPVLTLDAAVAPGVSAGITTAPGLTSNLAASIAASLDQAAGGGLSYQSGVSYSSMMEISPMATVGISTALTFAIDATTGALQLLFAAGAVSFDATADQVDDASLEAQPALSFAFEASYTPSAGNFFFDDIALDGSAGTATTLSLALGGTLSLSTAVDSQFGSLYAFETQLGLGTTASLAALSGTMLGAAIGLDIQADALPELAVTVPGGIGLAAFGTLLANTGGSVSGSIALAAVGDATLAAQAGFAPQISFRAEFSELAAAQLDAQAAMALAIDAALALAASSPQDVVVRRSINLDAVDDEVALSGEMGAETLDAAMTITVNLSGKAGKA